MALLLQAAASLEFGTGNMHSHCTRNTIIKEAEGIHKVSCDTRLCFAHPVHLTIAHETQFHFL